MIKIEQSENGVDLLDKYEKVLRKSMPGCVIKYIPHILILWQKMQMIEMNINSL